MVHPFDPLEITAELRKSLIHKAFEVKHCSCTYMAIYSSWIMYLFHFIVLVNPFIGESRFVCFFVLSGGGEVLKIEVKVCPCFYHPF